MRLDNDKKNAIKCGEVASSTMHCYKRWYNNKEMCPCLMQKIKIK